MVYALFVTSPTGHISVLTFTSAFDRVLAQITLSSQPVTLRTQEYGA
jgi:hypothetical protein